MTTTVHTVTTSKQTLTRDLADLDPKVRNQIPVVAIAVIAATIGILTGHVTVAEAAAVAGPPILSILIAYISTSTHKKLILDGISAGEDVVKETAPIIAATVPDATPVIEDVESLAAAVQAGVISDDTTTVPTVPPVAAAPIV